MTDPAVRPSGLRQRIPTAIALAILLLLDLFALPPIATLLLIAIVLLGGAWEWSAFLNTVRPMRIAPSSSAACARTRKVSRVSCGSFGHTSDQS